MSVPMVHNLDPAYDGMLGRFDDERGFIEDLLGPTDSLTRIFTETGAVRGNHVHGETTQWTYVLWGKLLIATRWPDGTLAQNEYGAGMVAREDPGVPHAWKAITTCLVLVATRGPRSGKNYEQDTTRLEEPLL
jgi:quercetin dioxygenase-like cupin family protein